MSVTLLITTQNRTPLLANSLQRLSTLTLPDEIVVVDDGGSDGCETLCQTWWEAGLPIHYLYNHQPFDAQCSLARNIGIKATDADMILTSEPELLWDTDLLAQMLAQHEAHPSDVISAGTIRHEQPDGGPVVTEGWVAPFAALYRRDWLVKINGWDEGFPDPWAWEDVDLLTRLRENGHGQVIDREIVCTHQYHEPRWCDQEANEAYFKAKVFPRDILANPGRQWGQCLTR